MFKIAAAASTLVAFTAVLLAMPSPDASGGRPKSAQDFAAAQAALPDGNPCAEKAWPYYEQNCLCVVKPDARPKHLPLPRSRKRRPRRRTLRPPPFHLSPRRGQPPLSRRSR